MDLDITTGHDFNTGIKLWSTNKELGKHLDTMIASMVTLKFDTDSNMSCESLNISEIHMNCGSNSSDSYMRSEINVSKMSCDKSTEINMSIGR